jgi:periplasmic divalent cation tolerance protein
MTDKRLVLSTTGSQDEARRIAHALVEKQLAACVNIVPGVESVYHWQGNIESGQEWLLIIKTTTGAFPSLRDTLQELHSYEVPECVALAIEDGIPEYLEWLGESVVEE